VILWLLAAAFAQSTPAPGDPSAIARQSAMPLLAGLPEGPTATTETERLIWARALVDAALGVAGPDVSRQGLDGLVDAALTMNPQASVASADLAALVLAGLLDGPESAAAVDLLTRLLTERAPRPAWRGLYARLADDARVRPDPALRLRLAFVYASVGGAEVPPDAGLTAIDRVIASAESPRVRAEAAALRARVKAERGEGTPADVPGAIAAGAAPTDTSLVVTSLILGTSCEGAIPCAQRLADLGERALARRRLAGSDEPGSYALLARLAREEGDLSALAEALASVAKATGAEGDQRAAARALLDVGEDRRAARFITDGSLQAEELAVGEVWLARKEPDPSARLQRAAAAAPENPFVAAAWAAALEAEGRHAEALAVWKQQFQARPHDRGVYGSLLGEAWRADHPEQAVEPTLAHLAAARTPEEWQQRGADLAGIAVGLASRAAEGGELALSGRLSRLSVAIAPRSLGGLMMAAGRAWGDGATDEALDLYAAARQLAPEDPGVIAARVKLLTQLERWDEAEAELRSGSIDPQDPAWRRFVLLRDLHAIGDGRQITRADAAALVARTAAYVDDAEVAHTLADTLLAGQRAEEAVDAYRHASALEPGSPWQVLGLANALVLRGEEADRKEVAAILPPLEDGPDPRVRRRAAELRTRLIRAEAEATRNSGLDRAAFDAYIALLAEDDGSSVRARLGELYLAHWQLEEAERAFRAAVSRIPVDETAWAGLTRAALARGRFDEAEQIAADHGILGLRGSDGRTLADEILVRRQTTRILAAVESGAIDAAAADVAELRARLPDDVEVAVLAGDLAMRRGRPDEAMDTALAALRAAPANESALGLVVSAAWKSGRLDEAVTALVAGRAAGAPPWVGDAELLARIGAGVARARQAAAAGRVGAGIRTVDDLEQALPVLARDPATTEPVRDETQARALALVGAAWLDLERPSRARRAFAAASTLTVGDADVLRGEAGAARAAGRPAEALRLFEAAWATTKDPRIGLDLAAVQLELGRLRAARRTLDAVARQPPVQRLEPISYPELLPSIAATQLDPGAVEAGPAAPQAPPAGTRLGWLAAHPVSDTPVDPEPLRARLATLRVASERVTAIGIYRGGPVGTEQLSAVAVDIAREGWVGDAVRYSVEALPAWSDDGAAGQVGAAGSLGLHSAGATLFGWAAQLGLSWPGGGGPVAPIGYLDLAFRPGPLDIHLSGTRAPTTQSRYAWAGAPGDPWLGRGTDSWAELRVGLGAQDGPYTGAMGRLGVLDGPSYEALGWRQVVGWGEVPARFGPLTVGVGLAGQVQGHDRSSSGFDADEAGVYTPIFSGGGQAYLTVRLTLPRVSVCATGSGGPQWTRSLDWFPEPDLYMIWSAGVGAAVQLSPSWKLGLVGDFDEGGQGWDDASVQLGVFHGPSPGSRPSPVYSSSTHGAPVREFGRCVAVLE
jgi:tetratricopeptide (TPR) repeat protein